MAVARCTLLFLLLGLAKVAKPVLGRFAPEGISEQSYDEETGWLQEELEKELSKDASPAGRSDEELHDRQKRQAQVLRNMRNGSPPLGSVSWKPAKSCNHIQKEWADAPSGTYYIYYRFDQTRSPKKRSYVWRTFCEMNIEALDGAWTFIPRMAIIGGQHMQDFITDLATQKEEIMFVVSSPSSSYRQKYSVVRQLPRFSKIPLLITTKNYLHGSARPRADQLGPYLYIRVLPHKEASENAYLGFQANGVDVKYSNCQSQPFNYWALYPNDRNAKAPTGWTNACGYDPCKSWLTNLIPLYGPRLIPNDLFFQMEMRFGGYANPSYYYWGCGTSLIGDGSRSSMTVAIAVR